jgi:hypothetical protein
MGGHQDGAVGRSRLSRPLRRFWWISLLVLLPVLTFGISSLLDGRPEAKVDLRFSAGTTEPFVYPKPTSASSLDQRARLAHSEVVLAGACRRFPTPPPNAPRLAVCAAQLGSEVSVTTDPSGGSLQLTVRGTSPQIAATHATDVAASLLATFASYALGNLTDTIKALSSARGARARSAAASKLALLASTSLPQTEIRSSISAGPSPLLPTLVAGACAVLMTLALARGGRYRAPPESDPEPRQEASGEVSSPVASE